MYICRCYVREDIIEKFKQMYGTDSPRKLAEFSLGLVISQGMKCSSLLEENLIRFKKWNPYLELIVDEELKGNNSHMYFFIEIEYVPIRKLDQLLAFYNK